MIDEARFIIDLIQASLRSQDLTFSELDPIKLSDYAKQHRLSALVYYLLLNQENPYKETYMELLRPVHFNTGIHYVSYTQAQKELGNLLDEVKIPYLFFKGLALSHYYPEAYLRLSSDIDLLIKEEDREKIEKSLFNKGYALSMKQLNEWIYTKGDIVVEVHTQLVHPSDVNPQVSAYFNELTRQLFKQNGSKHLSNEDFFVYQIVHLGKHLYGSGAGLRFMVDLVYSYRGMDLNEDQLWKILNDLKMEEFAKVVFSLMRRWFEEGPVVSEVSSHQMDLLESMLSGLSVFGDQSEKILIKARRIENQAKHSKVWVMIFPQGLSLSEQIHRWGIWILHPFKTSRQYRLIKQKENQAKAWLSELKEIGLYD